MNFADGYGDVRVDSHSRLKTVGFALSLTFAIAALGFGVYEMRIAQAATGRFDELSGALDDSKRELTSLNSEVKLLEESKTTLEKKLDESNAKVRELQTDSDVSQNKEGQSKDDLASLKAENEKLKKEVEDAKKAAEDAKSNSSIDMQLDPTITAHHVDLDGASFSYYLYRARPKASGQPLILSLHGSGESGDYLEALKGTSSLSRWILDGSLEPDCIVLMPQCPGFGWDSGALKALLDHVVEITGADKSRLSCTGVSMGGFGTWDMLGAYPTLFEAAAPIASSASDFDALSAVTARVRALDGTADGYDSTAGVDAINNGSGGGKAEHVWVDGAGHSDMCNIYGDEQFNPVPFLLDSASRPSAATTTVSA